MNTEYPMRRPQLTTYTNKTMTTLTSINKNNRKDKLKPLVSAIPRVATDDVTFALTEVRHLDEKIRKKHDSRTKIWMHETNNNFYGNEAMKNHAELQNIKNKVRRTGGWEAVDLKGEIDKKKYFPVEQVCTLMDSEHIKTQVNFRKKRNDKYQDLYTFTTQNRQICLKNILIDLLKTERHTIAIKENAVSAALNSANRSFFKDVNEFYAFTDNQKVEFHNIELKLAEKIKLNKGLIEDKRALTQEYKSIQEEIEKHIRGIIQYKAYADFVHSVLGGSPQMLNVNLYNIDLIKKDRDIDKIISYIILSFAFLGDNKEYEPEILKNPIMLNNMFFQLEANIIKYINIGTEVNNDLTKLKLENEAIIKELKFKEETHLKEKETLLRDNVTTSDLNTKNDDLIGVLKANRKLILDLHENTKGDDELSHKVKARKTSQELIKEILSVLDKKEQSINCHQVELAMMENESPDIFKKIVEKLKNKNKNLKWKEGIENMRILEEQRNLRYQERMNRYNLNKRITFPPPNILQKKKNYNKGNTGNAMENYEMLYY